MCPESHETDFITVDSVALIDSRHPVKVQLTTNNNTASPNKNLLFFVVTKKHNYFATPE